MTVTYNYTGDEMTYEKIVNSGDIDLIQRYLAITHAQLASVLAVVEEQANSMSLWMGQDVEEVRTALRRLHIAAEDGVNNPLIPDSMERVAKNILSSYDDSYQRHVERIIADLKDTDADCISVEEEYVAVDTQIDRYAWDAVIGGQ